MGDVHESPQPPPACGERCKLQNFFQFEEFPHQPNKSSRSLLEVDLARYLADDRSELETLFKYPSILRVFMSYKVGLPSSAPVERLFSRGSLTLSDLRGRLSDSNLEMLVLFHYNGFVLK